MPGSKVVSWPVPDGKPVLGCCFTVISTGVSWLAVSSCSWSSSTRGAGSLQRDAELPELPLSGTPGSTFLTLGLVSLGRAVPAPRGFVATVACGKRGCLQRQELYVRSQRESVKSLLCLKWSPFKQARGSGTHVGKPCQSLCWVCTERAATWVALAPQDQLWDKELIWCVKTCLLDVKK